MAATALVVNNNPNDSEPSCHSCQSTALYTDWAQGDCVCTSCGVVNEQHVMELGPEWREFKDDPNPTVTRCGLVPNSEELHLGGLEPTRISEHTFGTRNPLIRSKLNKVNRIIDYKMEREHTKALTSAQQALQVKKNHLAEEEEDTDEQEVRPEYAEMVLKEEDDANRLRTALFADKWSLERAIRWHDHGKDETERSQKIPALERASNELYAAHSMLMKAAQRLELSHTVTQEAAALLCRFATQRDGLVVRGVAVTRRRSDASNHSATDCRSSPQSRKRKLSPSHRERLVQKAAKDALNDYNTTKQHGAICAAILFLTARKLKHPRPLNEVCQSVEIPESMTENPHLAGEEQFVKKKHCSKAMNELKEVFPTFGKTAYSSDGIAKSEDHARGVAIANFVEHTLRRLRLPPVAETSVQCLVNQLQRANDRKVAVAAVAFFLCQAGSAMQCLAQQSRQQTVACPLAKKQKIDSSNAIVDSFDPSDGEYDSLKYFDEEQRDYELRRMWDAWNEQTTWARSLAQIENSCGVSQKLVLEFYAQTLYPQRYELLQTLQNAVAVKVPDQASTEGKLLQETPQASVLLTRMTAAGPLMKATAKL